MNCELSCRVVDCGPWSFLLSLEINIDASDEIPFDESSCPTIHLGSSQRVNMHKFVHGEVFFFYYFY